MRISHTINRKRVSAEDFHNDVFHDGRKSLRDHFDFGHASDGARYRIPIPEDPKPVHPLLADLMERLNADTRSEEV